MLVTVPVGWWANSLDRGPAERAAFDLHFSIGLVIFAFLVFRLLMRALDPAPALPGGLKPALINAAKATHFLLYATMLTLIVSGYLIQVQMRPSLDLFGTLQIGRPFEPGKTRHYERWPGIFIAIPCGCS
jgi:cytochrome b561